MQKIQNVHLSTGVLINRCTYQQVYLLTGVLIFKCRNYQVSLRVNQGLSSQSRCQHHARGIGGLKGMIFPRRASRAGRSNPRTDPPNLFSPFNWFSQYRGSPFPSSFRASHSIPPFDYIFPIWRLSSNHRYLLTFEFDQAIFEWFRALWQIKWF